MKGSTYKRCGCRHHDGRLVGPSCRLLKNRDHGTWYYRAELPPAPDGSRRYARKGGFATKRDAETALVDLLDRVQKRTHVNAGRITLGEWLDQWIAGKGRLRPTTRRTYDTHIRLYLKPVLGRIRLDELSPVDIERLYAAMRQVGKPIVGKPSEELTAVLAVRERASKIRPLSTSTIRRTHTTLMSALSTAAKRRLIPYNPAQHVELEPPTQTKAAVWTEDRVAHWRATGEHPKVAVWTPAQTGRFLDHTANDRLYALYHLIAFRGLRRGEAIGLPWRDVDLDEGWLTVSEQTLQYGRVIDTGAPKSLAGARTVALDETTIMVLRAHRARQHVERLALRTAWPETGRVFTREDGTGLVPEQVSRHFRELIRQAQLPPIRLHDLRHGAATLALASGANLKVVSEMLGHSTIAITANTYTSVLPEVAREAAEAASRLVPRTHRPSLTTETGPTSGPQPLIR